jgi:hypothetical protein
VFDDIEDLRFAAGWSRFGIATALEKSEHLKQKTGEK